MALLDVGSVTKLQWLARGAHEITQDRNIGAVSADASRVHGQAQAFGLIQIDPRVIQFRQAKALRRQHTIQPSGIHGPRGAMTLPRTARQFVKLLPVAFVPSSHAFVYYYP